MINVVDILLQAEQYNGHFQTELTNIKHSDAIKIVKELEARFDKQCELREYADGGGSIYISNFWGKGENGDHVDRLVVSFNTITYDLWDRDTERESLKCICEGNWRLLVHECESLFGRKFKTKDGQIYVFFGLVHTNDDYYYGMMDQDKKVMLLSCVGNFDTWEMTLCEENI